MFAKLETIIGLVRIGVTTLKTVVDAVRANRLEVEGDAGELLSAEDVETHCADAEAERVKTASGAEGRIAGRTE